MAGPANPAANNQNPYYGAHPQHFAPGGYYLAPPPASPGYFDYEGALRNCQYQLEMSQEENARKTAEIDALRNALATKGIELEASASGDLKLRTSLQLAIDAVLILDFYSEAVVLKYREMCNERGIEGTLLVSELSEIAKALPLGRQKTVISQVRDRVLAVNKALIDGLDNGLHHHEELRRLRAWLRNQLAEVGDDSAYDQFIMGRCISGYKWKPFLK
ncbi:MAG: hypothetical protein HETSPECPRED_009508 [Heterodermia speciosa]|uniref:Uncharacterized protein n=1 Tax=Heterodermia speciosa TaxID=116794 RepID=A0A8H3EN70_9LECA|nr:MAG: hypothetical protein HETSPECPRED_009508 [Heterodermia speciosa]